MIEYDNSNQLRILFQLTGSVIPQSLPIGIFTGGLGLGLALRRELDDSFKDESYILKSFAIQVLATVVGYLIVVRTNMALSRWMNGISDVKQMLSKWGDAYLTLVSFFSGRQGSPEMERRILLFRVRIAHWFSLMSCLAFATLRGGVCLTSLEDVPIKELLHYDDGEATPVHQRRAQSFAAPSANSRRSSRHSKASAVRYPVRRSQRESLRDQNGGGESSTQSLIVGNTSQHTEDGKNHVSPSGVAFSEDLDEVRISTVQPKTVRKNSSDTNLEMGDAEGIRELDLFVLHRPTHEELVRLEATADKVNLICLWIIQGIVLETRAKTLDTPPPIVTRVFQELSNGMLGFSQAHKVAMVPFPFPFAQMVSILLCFLYVVLPFYVDSFTKNVIATPLVSFFIPLCYNGLNCLAIELEAPFGSDDNDVDIEVMHEEFLQQIIDVLRQPMIPPMGTDRGLTPEKKISRGIRKVVKEVHERVDGKWQWDLLDLHAEQEKEEKRKISADGSFQLGANRKEAVDIASQTIPEENVANPLYGHQPNGLPNTRAGWKDFHEKSDMSWAEESNFEETGKDEKLGVGPKFGLCGPNRCGAGCENGTPLTRVIGDADYESNGHQHHFV
jgi:predicted membrane chloride channel (bestrophin family)